MVSPPAHTRWCVIHEQYYRGAVCMLCARPVSPHRRPGTPGRVLVYADGDKLRAARLAKRWSLRELAHLAGMGYAHVHHIETASRRRITLQTAQRLAEALDTTVTALTRDGPAD